MTLLRGSGRTTGSNRRIGEQGRKIGRIGNKNLMSQAKWKIRRRAIAGKEDKTGYEEEP